MKILIGVGAGEVQDSYFTPRVIEELSQIGELVWNETGKQGFTKEELIEHIKDVDVFMSGWGSPAVDADVVAAAKNLKVHAHTAGSVAGLVCKEEYDKGIIVLSGNDVFARSVAEGTLVYTLNILRRNEELMKRMRDNLWKMEACNNSGLVRKKVGIIGYGQISRYYMDLLRWFEPDLYIASEYISDEACEHYNCKKATLEYIFSECDVISLHSAWNKDTEGMITRELLQMIKPGAVFVNTARGKIVDEEALADELKTGRFKAALDVYAQEPVPVDHPFRTLPNVQCYPHMAGPTFDMREQVMFKLMNDLRNIKAGLPFDDEISWAYAQRMTLPGKKKK
ncbi:MAG: hydroxyacid dehydrogenase [Clostridia bacterium]